MGKRFCSECGNEMGEDEKFCRFCGAPVDSVDVNEETVGQKVDNSIAEVKSKISSSNGNSKFNIKIIAPIVAIIVIIFLAWCVMTAFSGTDIELDGQTFHIATKYSKSDLLAQKFTNEISDFKPDNVVYYMDNSTYNDDYFIIVTKNVGNKNLNDLGVSGEPLTVNGKQGVWGYYQSLNPQWGLSKNNEFYLQGLEKLGCFSYVDDGVWVSIILGDDLFKEDLNNIIK